MTPHSRETYRPSFAKNRVPLNSRRAQGKPSAECTRRSRAPERTGIPCAEAHGQGLQVQPGHPGFPCAMALRLLRTLPGVPGLLAPVAAQLLARLDPSVGGSGPYGLTVRASAARFA